MRAMRILALISSICSIGILCNCQPTYAGSSYRYGGAPVIHGQTPVPQVNSYGYNAGHGRLVPARPLAQPHTPAPKAQWAKAVCVMDPRTGRVLFSHNADERRQVASTQKIVTALCVCDAGDMDHLVTISADDHKKGYSTGLRQIKPGQQFTRRSMLQAMLTGSYNNVAYALARDAAGSEEAFVARMNARARRMKMHNSHFANPHGLPGAQYSTAKDMALAACYAYVNPIIRECVDTPTYYFTLADGSPRQMNNTNKLLNKYAWVNGMKTGYTDAAGHCLISSGAMNGQAVVVVVLGCPNRKTLWSESEKYLKWAMGVS